MKPSVVRRLSRLLLIQGILVVLVLAAFAAFSAQSVSDALFGTMDNALALEGRSMEDKLSAGNVLLERLIYRNDNYSLLHSESDSDRYFVAWELNESLAVYLRCLQRSGIYCSIGHSACHLIRPPFPLWLLSWRKTP